MAKGERVRSARSGHSGRTVTRRTAALWLGAAFVPACTAAPEASHRTVDSVQETLNERAAALLGRDEQAFLASCAPEQSELRAEERRQFRNLAQVPIGEWAYRVGAVRRDGAKAYADVEVHYRIAEYDTAPVVVARAMELGLRDGRWYVTADRPAKGSAQQIWQLGAVTAVHGQRSLVLAVGQQPDRARALADTVDRAVPAVSRAWRSPWAERVVVLVPPSVEGMGALLGAPGAGYRGIAAVTTGETGSTRAVPADRVIVNPSAYDALDRYGQQVVLTHETTHVATRAQTTSTTPMWLSEGFADWVAYRDTARTTGQIAPEIQRAVRSGDLPDALPGEADFSFGGDAATLAVAYEGGWLACEFIVGRWGEQVLLELYHSVGGQRGDPAGAVDRELTRVLGMDTAEFTARWRGYLRQRLD
ncbi:hypothetical protein ACH4E8_12600 [Streptomyces sp. NPDC017979]|uniref:hypothetical protein n=1 Tax=Streptomyces sp. NPDC017979 TaxID=3365024 RepID=UPI0037AE77BA